LKLRVHAREGQYARSAAQHALTQFSLHKASVLLNGPRITHPSWSPPRYAIAQ
jgi:hypothetical protein